MAGATTGEALIHFWMAAKIILKAGGDVLSLGNDCDGAGGKVRGARLLGGEGGELLVDFVEEEGEMGASEDDGVDEWVLVKEFLEGILDEVISTRFVEFIILH